MIQFKALRPLRASEKLVLYMYAYKWVPAYLAREEKTFWLMPSACPLKSYQKRRGTISEIINSAAKENVRCQNWIHTYVKRAYIFH